MKRFDSSKIEDSADAETMEDQEKTFENSPEKERREIIEKTKKQAKEIKQGRQAFLNALSNGWVSDAIKIKDEINLPEEFIQQSAKEGFIKCLANGWVKDAIKIKDKFNLPEEFLSSAEVQQAAKEGFINCLSNGHIDKAIEIKDKIREEFSIIVQPLEIIQKFPLIKTFLNKIKTVSPNFYEQIQRSTELLLELFRFKDEQEQFFKIIKENPFLLKAAMENTRFGSKLLIKYPQLDELSKQNIEFLFNAKKDIVKKNPDIKPQSLEFRQLMQERLKHHKNNQEILAEMEKSEINIDQWLNYQKTSHFSLDSSKSQLAFSQTIATPINRIKQTIDAYAHHIKQTLTQYKKELSEYQILIEDPKRVEVKIAHMKEEQEKAKAQGNDKKAQGIQKGIDDLSQKLTKIKTIPLWDKVLGGIDTFNRLKNHVFEVHERLIQAENELEKKSSGKTPSGKEIQDIKQKIAKAKQELRSRFGLLENRIEKFKTNLPKTIESALGKERTNALIQEIEEELAEQFDHYRSDRSALANLFSETSDTEKDKLDSQPMSIFVWARNPDIDLYQSNYSDCCIRIDSVHMGSESTIADYNTDVGIQVVNIWDEVTHEPVTAAWCWLGKNEKGEISLVVDNIESNTLYSNNYSEQLTQELFNYLKDYATSIGVTKVLLGKRNNDLPTIEGLANLADDNSAYEKIGGYNRMDGYFLEAEDERVKVIWEK